MTFNNLVLCSFSASFLFFPVSHFKLQQYGTACSSRLNHALFCIPGFPFLYIKNEQFFSMSLNNLTLNCIFFHRLHNLLIIKIVKNSNKKSTDLKRKRKDLLLKPLLLLSWSLPRGKHYQPYGKYLSSTFAMNLYVYI